MNIPIFIQFVIIIFISLINSDKAFKLFRQDQIDQLERFKYKIDTHQSTPLNNRYIVVIKIRDRNNKHSNSEYIRPIARINYDVEKKKQKLRETKMLSQHLDRMREITNFMKDHIMATLYLYTEVKRIQRDRQVKDALREMIEYLGKPENKEEKATLLNFFVKNRRIKRKEKKNVWDQHTNDLVINTINDPFNEGTIS